MAASSVVMRKLSTPLSDPSENSVNMKFLRKFTVAIQCVSPVLMITNTRIGRRSSTANLLL